MSNATVATRAFNFSAGPAVLPESVLEQAQADLWDIDGSGIGILEHSHRGKVFDRVIDECEADCRRVGGISDDYAVLFLQGGASLQFGMIPVNFLPNGKTADYINTGVWTSKAIAEAKLFGNIHLPYDGKPENFKRIPNADELKFSPAAVYLHYCSNNTIYGTRFNHLPKTAAPLIADMSSEMFSRPIDIDAHALIYAGAQKNLGPAGVTLVIIRKDFAEQGNAKVTSMMSYQKHIAEGSRMNTPPTFGIYIMGLVFKWILQQGGVAEIEKLNDAKARLIYDAIDRHAGFYLGHSEVDSRSVMNIPFRTPSEELDKKFLAGAAEQRMDGLKGHRNTGGIRASIYNAFPRAGCEALANYMDDFAAKHG
ncbi:MAG TPA: 3-phosphoserine/phosphohydroxythreonine transaminase [Pirellulaceae bacterium]|nr:3-phosphoserine/phosphohydroxythreonine transaminase [Pirellulaceae bacterium]HMO91086.1 3-phosphoserine/phosphohydroxythreonine transaminase [Pirellulaceae bacterium]HMP71185.1 3-phosphoserine/phosphohydroxythreonine transaminase [Pirellulaceae bacterium]